MSESFKSDAEKMVTGGVTLPADSAAVLSADATIESPADSSVEISADSVAHRFSFRGSTAEYFKIWFINVLFSVLTLGVYSAWAKVRNRRYFYTNTFLDGANFDYHANPLVILASRVIVLLFLALVQILLAPELYGDKLGITLTAFLFFFLPWAWVRGLSFNARNSSYRNVRFSFRRAYGMPYFLCSAVPLSIALLIFGVLFLGFYFTFFYQEETSFISFGKSGKGYLIARSAEIVGAILSIGGLGIVILMGAFLLRTYHSFKVGRHQLGVRHFSFNNPAIGFYVLAVVGFVLWIFALILTSFGTYLTIDQRIYRNELFLVTAVAVGFCALFIPLAQAKSFRLLWNNVRLEGGAIMRCQFSTFSFAKVLMVNLFAILFSLGLLTPWARIQKARFLSKNMVVFAPPTLFDSIAAKRDEEISALGEEMDTSQGFDFDVGII